MVGEQLPLGQTTKYHLQAVDRDIMDREVTRTRGRAAKISGCIQAAGLKEGRDCGLAEVRTDGDGF